MPLDVSLLQDFCVIWVAKGTSYPIMHTRISSMNEAQDIANQLEKEGKIIVSVCHAADLLRLPPWNNKDNTSKQLADAANRLNY